MVIILIISILILYKDDIEKEKKIKILLNEKSNIFQKSICLEKDKENKKEAIPDSTLTKKNSDDYNIIKQIE